MKPVMNTVGAFYSALAQRDAKALRAVLSDDFSFRGPMMQFDEPDAFTKMMISFPFEATASGSRFIVDGNNVAHIFRWDVSAPAKAEIPMCEILTVAKGKIQRSELFFDTKLFPSGQ
ncbi:MAG: nuclear transport factor 2 family protein [Nitrosomonadales bacterium]|nr:nuclear transport factor 2 family protein [Nitrosomonadales bacterium]